MTFDTSDLDAIDSLPTPTPPALCFVQAQLMAEHAARRGLDKVTAGKHEQALLEVTKYADMIAPAAAIADSPEGWARRGAREGIIDAWRPETMGQRAPEFDDFSQLEIYTAAYTMAAAAVVRIVREEGGR